MPEFAAAALLLKESNSPALLAKLDGVAQARSAARYGIKGFPTLLFFTNGTQQPYTGGFTRNEIVVWIRKRTGMPAVTISSKTKAEEVLNRNGTTVVGFFGEFMGPEYDEFVSAAKEEEDTEFVQVDNAELAGLLNLGMQKSPPFVSILKSEPETYVPYESKIEKKSLLWFVEVNKRPLVTKLEHHNYMKIYSSPIKLQVTVFSDAQSSGSFLALFQDVAKQFKGQILFLFSDTADEELSRPILTLYGVEPDEPIVTGFNYANGLKYLLEAHITKDSLKEFCRQLVTGELHQYYKSEAIPTEREGDVQIVVGKNFQSVVYDDSKDVFLEVYTPWCVRCNAASKAFDVLGKHFKDISSLTVARINAAVNEHPLLQVYEYPTFLFYPASNKTNPVLAPKKWTAKSLVQFVHQHASTPIVFPTKVDKMAKDEL